MFTIIRSAFEPREKNLFNLVMLVSDGRHEHMFLMVVVVVWEEYYKGNRIEPLTPV